MCGFGLFFLFHINSFLISFCLQYTIFSISFQEHV
nr:MAG TPA: hypothetical protein [Caudoviricetes sp.]